MAHYDNDVLVIGAGVSGLTTATCLAEAGLRVEVRTDRPSSATTSAEAGAMWGPYLVEPRDRVAAWSRHTLAVLRDLAHDPEATGSSPDLVHIYPHGQTAVLGESPSRDGGTSIRTRPWRNGSCGAAPRSTHGYSTPASSATGWAFAPPGAASASTSRPK